MPICRQAPSSISAAIRRRNGRVDLGCRRIGKLRRRRIVALDYIVHFAHVQAGFFAVDVRQPTARLDDDQAGALDHRAVPEIGGAQIEIALLVERTGLEHDDIDRIHEAPIVVGDFTKVDRDVVAAPVIVLPPVVGRVVQAKRVDIAAVGIGIEHGAGAHRQAVANFDVRQLVDACAERAVEDIGLAE